MTKRSWEKWVLLGGALFTLILVVWGFALYTATPSPWDMPADQGYSFMPLCAYGPLGLNDQDTQTFNDNCAQAYTEAQNMYVTTQTDTNHAEGGALIVVGVLGGLTGLAIATWKGGDRVRER